MSPAVHSAPRIAPRIARWIVGAIALSAVVSGGVRPAAATDEQSERAQLERSLSGACKNFDSERDWAALDKCNRAWFRAHERAVWQLNLNPHARGKIVNKPSS